MDKDNKDIIIKFLTIDSQNRSPFNEDIYNIILDGEIASNFSIRELGNFSKDNKEKIIYKRKSK